MRARIADIIHHASQLSGVSADLIVSPSRLNHVVRVRQAVCLVAREQLNGDGQPAHTFVVIGRVLGRDHSTIVHACDKAALIAGRDPVYAAFISDLRDAATNGAPFAGNLRAPLTVQQVVVEQKAAPVIVQDRAPHIKKITLKAGETPDEGHKFHAGIEMGSAALLRALAA